MTKGIMNRTTNLFILLIVISFILPATAIRYGMLRLQLKIHRIVIVLEVDRRAAVAVVEMNNSRVVAVVEVDRRVAVAVVEMNNSRVVAVVEIESRVTIPEMRLRIWPTSSWPCTTASALPFHFQRSCGTINSPPRPRLGPNIWRRQVSSHTRAISNGTGR
jgi:hypothetical protein